MGTRLSRRHLARLGHFERRARGTCGAAGTPGAGSLCVRGNPIARRVPGALRVRRRQAERLLFRHGDHLRPSAPGGSDGKPSARCHRPSAALRSRVAAIRGVRKVAPRRGIILEPEERTDASVRRRRSGVPGSGVPGSGSGYGRQSGPAAGWGGVLGRDRRPAACRPLVRCLSTRGVLRRPTAVAAFRVGTVQRVAAVAHPERFQSDHRLRAHPWRVAHWKSVRPRL